ncbi:LRRN4 C-terminal-like protein [Brachyhypopomus gauderio]|uniref:LRRN4 C-terminal-like protein n=1 Tax=Brachyhypopomus gauderio TaxID=698409 RepID=UPI004041B086
MFGMSNFTLFLLVFVVDFMWAASVSPLTPDIPVTKTRIFYIPDIDDDYHEETSEPPNHPRLPGETTTLFIPQECDYDPCVVHEVPCSEISTRTKCYCPGLTGPQELPLPPQLREVKQETSGEVHVHWCAPLSTVTQYRLKVEGGESLPPVFGQFSRNGTVRGLKVGSRLCVVAVNDAGFSVETETSCIRFMPQELKQGAIRAGVIAGCIGLLALLSLVTLLLWRRRSCRKGRSLNGDGLGNPSYTTNETL